VGQVRGGFGTPQAPLPLDPLPCRKRAAARSAAVPQALCRAASPLPLGPRPCRKRAAVPQAPVPAKPSSASCRPGMRPRARTSRM